MFIPFWAVWLAVCLYLFGSGVLASERDTKAFGLDGVVRMGCGIVGLLLLAAFKIGSMFQ